MIDEKTLLNREGSKKKICDTNPLVVVVKGVKMGKSQRKFD
jgi:hypothetical protein